MALLMGCASPQPAAPAAPAGGGPAASDQPVKPKVDKVVIALAGFSEEGNDVGRDFSAPQNVQLRPMYDKLVGVDPKTGKLTPELATEWKVEPDAKSYRFTLRKGVQFHDNVGEFTAKDVAMTFQDVTQDGTKASNGPIFKALISGIDQVSPYEVVTNLKTADAEFIINISQMVGGFEIVSRADFDKRGYPTMSTRPLAGTGPYQYDSRQQGTYIRFGPIPFKHYRITPDFPQLEMRIIGEASTRMAGVLTGEVHMAPLSDDLLEQMEKQSMKVLKGQLAGLRTELSFRGHYLNDINDPSKGYKFPNSPIMNPKVRQALSKAVDRDALNKAFFKGKGQPMFLDAYHPSRQGWNPDWEKRFPDEYGYDPAKARELLTQAGYGPGNPLKHTFNLSGNYGYYPELKDMAEAITNYWRAIGVEVTLEQLDPVASAGKANARAYVNNSSLVPTSIRQFFGIGIYGAGAMINTDGVIGGKSGGDFIEFADQVMVKLRRTLDPNQWDAVYRETGNMLYDKHSLIPLFWLPIYAVVDPNIVADYPFSGTLTGPYADIEYIKPAR